MAKLVCPNCETENFEIKYKRRVISTEFETRIGIAQHDEPPWDEPGDESFDKQENDTLMSKAQSEIVWGDEYQDDYYRDIEEVTEQELISVRCEGCHWEPPDWQEADFSSIQDNLEGDPN